MNLVRRNSPKQASSLLPITAPPSSSSSSWTTTCAIALTLLVFLGVGALSLRTNPAFGYISQGNAIFDLDMALHAFSTQFTNECEVINSNLKKLMRI